MQATDFFLRRTVQEVREMEEVPLLKLESKRTEAKGLFKGKERKTLDKEIADLQKAIVKKYKKDLAEWERKAKKMENLDPKRNFDKSNNEQHYPPERESVRDRLRQLQRESKQLPIQQNNGRER